MAWSGMYRMRKLQLCLPIAQTGGAVGQDHEEIDISREKEKIEKEVDYCE
jgi:hypothetical protein